MRGERVIAGTIVGAEDVNVWHIRSVAGEGSLESEASDVGIAAIGVDTLLVGPVGANEPIVVKRMLDAGSGVNSVGRFVIRINQRAKTAARNAAGVAGIDTCSRGRVDCLECSHPAVLR